MGYYIDSVIKRKKEELEKIPRLGKYYRERSKLHNELCSLIMLKREFEEEDREMARLIREYGKPDDEMQ